MKSLKHGKTFFWGKSRFLLFVFTPVALFLMHFANLTNQQPYQIGQDLAISTSKREPNIFFLATGGDLNCGHKYNHACRFWFFLRCVVFGGLANVIVVPPKYSKLRDVLQFAEQDDVVLIHWRVLSSQNHTIIPEFLRIYMDFKNRKASNYRLRIGILHTANEKNRMNWPWYVHADFVIRNYWVNKKLPAHVQYIPLGPQYPHLCGPTELHENEFISPRNFQIVTPSCSCGELSFLPSSKRRYLWSFSGSMRRNRGSLVAILNERKKLDNGVVLVSRQFGGDGTVGSRDPSRNPKTEHLRIIANSKFVFCPCGNVMETHRIYEAVILGAIPVIENCEPEFSDFFPIPELLHPNGKEMVRFVVNFKNRTEDVMLIQARLRSWWLRYGQEIRTNVSRTVLSTIPKQQRSTI